MITASYEKRRYGFYYCNIACDSSAAIKKIYSYLTNHAPKSAYCFKETSHTLHYSVSQKIPFHAELVKIAATLDEKMTVEGESL